MNVVDREQGMHMNMCVLIEVNVSLVFATILFLRVMHLVAQRATLSARLAENFDRLPIYKVHTPFNQ